MERDSSSPTVPCSSSAAAADTRNCRKNKLGQGKPHTAGIVSSDDPTPDPGKRGETPDDPRNAAAVSFPLSPSTLDTLSPSSPWGPGIVSFSRGIVSAACGVSVSEAGGVGGGGGKETPPPPAPAPAAAPAAAAAAAAAAVAAAGAGEGRPVRRQTADQKGNTNTNCIIPNLRRRRARGVGRKGDRKRDRGKTKETVRPSHPSVRDRHRKPPEKGDKHNNEVSPFAALPALANCKRTHKIRH
ncbi:hypothetical protein EBH_0085410 [Eimeria brunetti]|uniref:Uncharacterized protein n=1 Tax=Eimeria brunetti TaxID=51314 RepID=U6LV68_9EIME|nr:hypothetical protein EBH_0085410 [Eimeria brunetti]